uniref:YGGT family n=1 Tax=Theileria annulata TaxID=5874 RepID=A0A3B0MVA6_THEAN
MIIHIKAYLGLFLIFLNILFVESYLLPNNSYSFINTFGKKYFEPQTHRFKSKVIAKELISRCKNKTLQLNLHEDNKHGFSNSLDERYPDPSQFNLPDHGAKNVIARYMSFKDALIANSATLIMLSIYLIRIFRTLVIARSFLDTLVHINPYLPPFNFIYDTTNFYLKFCDSFPKILGVNVLSEIPWFFLSALERYLFSLLGQEP